MPELDTPNFPTGEKPHVSPNPKGLKTEYENGGQETPVVIVTAPKEQVDLTEESAQIDALREYTVKELAKKEELSNKSQAIGSTPSETKYTSEKAVADYVQATVMGAIEGSY